MDPQPVVKVTGLGQALPSQAGPGSDPSRAGTERAIGLRLT